MKLHRGQCSISTKALAALEAAAWQRFKAHVDMDRMANDLREQRDEVDALSELLWEALPELSPELRERVTARIGEPPVHHITPIGVTLMGKFVEIGA